MYSNSKKHRRPEWYQRWLSAIADEPPERLYPFWKCREGSTGRNIWWRMGGPCSEFAIYVLSRVHITIMSRPWGVFEPPPKIANHDYDFGGQKHLETHPNPSQQPESSSVKTSTWSINNLRTDSPMGQCGKLWWNNKSVRISKYKVGPKKNYQ